MQSARFVSAAPLVVVAGVLVQKRWQNSATDHDVGEPVGGYRAKALAVTDCPLLIVWSASRLIDPGKRCDTKDRDHIARSSHCQVKLQFSGEWRGTGVVNHVKVRDDAESALRFLDLDLLGGDFYRRIAHVHRSCRRRDLQLAVRQNEVLAGTEDNARRIPIGKSLGGDDHIIGSGSQLMELESPVVIRQHGADLVVVRALQEDSRARKHIAAHIGHRASNDCGISGRSGILSSHRHAYGNYGQDYKPKTSGFQAGNSLVGDTSIYRMC